VRPRRRYARPEKVRIYRRATASKGKLHMLRAVYAPLVADAARVALEQTHATAIRALEFGCGAGLGTQALMDELIRTGIDVELIVGADAEPAMIAAAQHDLAECDFGCASQRVAYVVASHERLSTEVPAALGISARKLAESFQLAFGLSTFRHTIQDGTAAQSVRELHRLLSPGGRLVVIDLNNRFPYRMPRLPTLEDYVRLFADGGFEIEATRHVGWIPHSADGLAFLLARAASQTLHRIAPSRAMRSVVVARKPE
jgi:SAM-dependent methyltransferase